MGTLTEIQGLLVGHYTDDAAQTGCTAILCPGGAVAGVDVRGSAPGTRETDLLRGYNVVERVHAILLSGGSAYGLDSASGAMQYLEETGSGFDAGVSLVPIVPAAVIFDLDVGDPRVRPGKREGYAACQNATAAPVQTGRVGAGRGATVGKAFGPQYALPGGVGSSCIHLQNGIKVAALVVVNAMGDIYDPTTGALLAAAHIEGKLTPCLHSPALGRAGFGNTTIGVVATNARLTREEANKLASMGHDGMALSIRPVHTNLDGDTLFALSTGEAQADLLPILVAGAEAVSRAVMGAVRPDLYPA
ncbi:MAG: P1 family peptidase [Christensenellaceae bacterium]|jgi:L-aminopeptidase/D-esterase-like protein|nr:P1 family peptidase [Christensenellaceae bacterium]